MYGVARAPDVPIRVVTEAQLLDELLGRGNDGADRIDGVYQDAERGIALVDRGRPKDDPETAAVLVHEFVHAIQDERYDLALWKEQLAHDVDSSLALRTVSEGQATYAQFRAIYAMLGYDLSRHDLSAAIDEFRSRVLSSAYDEASPYLASFTTFPYAVGVGAAARAWSPTGLHFDERQFSAPPLTSLQALGDSYALDLAAPDARLLESPPAEQDYRLVDQTRLGAFLLELFLHRHGASAAQARALALDWVTDRLWVYAGPNDTTGFLWEVELQAPPVGLDFAASAFVLEQAGARLFFAGSAGAPEFLLTSGRAFLDSGR
jgi:hypothetical protein